MTQSLTKKTCGSQLKNKSILNTFRLARVVTLAESGDHQAALFFLPITLWRVAILWLRARKSENREIEKTITAE
jgi:hypothetical protein